MWLYAFIKTHLLYVNSFKQINFEKNWEPLPHKLGCDWCSANVKWPGIYLPMHPLKVGQIGQHLEEKSMIMRALYSGNPTQIKAKSLASWWNSQVQEWHLSPVLFWVGKDKEANVEKSKKEKTKKGHIQVRWPKGTKAVHRCHSDLSLY